MVFIIIYINNLQIVDKDKASINKIQVELSNTFKRKIISKPVKFLDYIIIKDYKVRIVIIS